MRGCVVSLLSGLRGLLLAYDPVGITITGSMGIRAGVESIVRIQHDWDEVNLGNVLFVWK